MAQKPFAQLSPDLQRKARALRNFIQKEAPALLGPVAINFAIQNFRKQGFQGAAFEKWKPRKTVDRRGRDLTHYKRGKNRGKRTKFGHQNQGRAILVRSGALRTGFSYQTQPGRVLIYNYKNYAQWHNTGTDTLPRRQFIGTSPVLTHSVKRLIEQKIKHILAR